MNTTHDDVPLQALRRMLALQDLIRDDAIEGWRALGHARAMQEDLAGPAFGPEADLLRRMLPSLLAQAEHHAAMTDGGER